MLALPLLLVACGGGDDEPTAAGSGATTTTASAALVPLPARKPQVTTGRALDLAIAGDGMFVLHDSASWQTVYSRHGHFDLDRDGFLVDSEGRAVMGHVPNPGQLDDDPPQAQPLPPVPRYSTPLATTLLLVEGNLDSRLASPVISPFTPHDADTYNFAMSVTLYDAKGHDVALTLYYVKREDEQDRWTVYATVNGVPWPSGGGPLIDDLAFDANTGAVTGTWVRGQRLTIPAGMPLASGGRAGAINLMLGLGGSTQFGSPFAVTKLLQDGRPVGRLTAVDVSPRGHIAARYDNGDVQAVGQLLLAKFTTVDRFRLVGERAYGCGQRCVAPLIEVPGVLLLGTIVSGSLESP